MTLDTRAFFYVLIFLICNIINPRYRVSTGIKLFIYDEVEVVIFNVDGHVCL